MEAYAMWRVFASGGAEGESVTLESEAAGVTGEAGEAAEIAAEAGETGGIAGSEGIAAVEGSAEEAAGAIDGVAGEASEAIEGAAGKGKIRIESGNATIGLSQTKIEHVFKNHTLGRMKETIDHLMEKGLKETAENLLNEKSFFNPKWSEKKVTEAVNYVYNEAVSKGIKNGKYTTIVSGEKITVCFQNGSFHTAFGKYKFLLSDFGY